MGLNGTAGSSRLYSFEAAAGKQLSVITYGGTGNVSVYIAQGREPSASTTMASRPVPARPKRYG